MIDLSGLRPEVQLLLSCARTRLNPAVADQCRQLLNTALDWPYLIRLANYHMVMPLLYWNLRQLPAATVPPDVLADLHERFQANAHWNVFLTGELIKLMRWFEENQISAVPYKGPALAVTLYGNLALRQFGDLDILVPGPEALRAKELLERHGYRFTAELTRDQETTYFQAGNQHHFLLVRDDGQVLVELHWDVAPRHFFPASERQQLWTRLEPMNLAGTTVATFAPEDLLLLICMHGARHCWTRLGLVADVAEFVRARPELDWDRVIQRASQWRSRRMLLLALQLANQLLALPLPAPLRSELEKTPGLHHLAQQVRSRLVHDNERYLGVLDRVTYQLKVQDRRLDQIRYGLSLVMEPTLIELGNSNMPGYFSGLYRLFRPLRLVGKYSARLVDHLTKQSTSIEL